MDTAPTISLVEAARRLRLSYGRAYDSMLRGELPARKVGAAWRVEAATVETLVGERAESSATITTTPDT